MAQSAGLVVYCRPWCGDCRRALRWLDDMGYEYTEIDIDADAAGRARCVELAGKVVTPTFEVGEQVVVNFDPRLLRDLLGRRDER